MGPAAGVNKALVYVPIRLIRAALIAAAVRDTRRHICGVRIEVKAGRCTVIGTDGCLITAATLEAAGADDFNAFLPRYAMHGLRLAGDGHCAVERDGNLIKLYARSETRAVPVEWKELDWRHVVPDAFDNGPVHLQAKVLATVQRIAEIHGDRAPVLQTNQKRQLAAWCSSDAITVAMGVRLDGEKPIGVPAWALSPKAAA